MESSDRKYPSLYLIGLTGQGKSRLGNKLSGKKEFIESAGCDSCTKIIKKVIGKFDIEIVDTPGLDDTDNDDKNIIASIFKDIKENKPNVLAFVQNASNKRFVESSKKAVEEICKMFDSKSVWNNIVIIFTFSATISKESREDRAKNYMESIFKVLNKYYNENKLNDNLPIPKKLRYFFVELGDKDDYKLEQDTLVALGDLVKLVCALPRITSVKDKLIIDMIIKRNCEESIGKYDRYITDENGTMKCVLANTMALGGTLTLSKGAGVLSMGALMTAGVASFPIIAIGGLAAYGITSLLGLKLIDKLREVDWDKKKDSNFLEEEYITFDEVTYIYHDNTKSNPIRINIEYFYRAISK
jgi:hypothetical protein